jgi:hypothetical protein
LGKFLNEVGWLTGAVAEHYLLCFSGKIVRFFYKNVIYVIVWPSIALIFAVPFCSPIYNSQRELRAHYCRCRMLGGWKKMFEEWASRFFWNPRLP